MNNEMENYLESETYEGEYYRDLEFDSAIEQQQEAVELAKDRYKGETELIETFLDLAIESQYFVGKKLKDLEYHLFELKEILETSPQLIETLSINKESIHYEIWLNGKLEQRFISFLYLGLNLLQFLPKIKTEIDEREKLFEYQRNILRGN